MNHNQEPEPFERQLRQAIYMLIAAIATEYGPEMAARIVKGLYEKYAEQKVAP